MRNILKLPIKDFMRNPIIKNSTYKKFLDFIFNISKNRTGINDTNTFDLKNNGYIIIKNFLSVDRFEALKKLLNEIKDFTEDDTEGFLYKKRNISQLIQKEFKEFDEINEIVKNFYQFEEIILPNIIYQINLCENIMKYDISNTSQYLHIDRIYNTLKFFYFISDVRSKDFPFTLIPKTQSGRLNPKYYDEAFAKHMKKDGYPSYDEIVKNANLGKELSFVLPKNTLVIADTSCLHRRGDFELGSKRFLLQGNYQSTTSTQNIIKNLFKKFIN